MAIAHAQAYSNTCAQKQWSVHYTLRSVVSGTLRSLLLRASPFLIPIRRSPRTLSRSLMLLKCPLIFILLITRASVIVLQPSLPLPKCLLPRHQFLFLRLSTNSAPPQLWYQQDGYDLGTARSCHMPHADSRTHHCVSSATVAADPTHMGSRPLIDAL